MYLIWRKGEKNEKTGEEKREEGRDLGDEIHLT